MSKENEIWKPIYKFGNLYVSNLGNIKRNDEIISPKIHKEKYYIST